MRHPRVRIAIFVVYVVLSLLYLIWRALFTLNFENPIYAGIFFMAEVIGILAAVVFYALIVRRKDEPLRPLPQTWPTIDVLIATYNEDPDLVRTTAVAARDLRGPHRTWICDDGRRPAIAELAREIGVGYLMRSSSEHFKAGNLNNALAHTDGELVLVLDADHVARPQMLERLAPLFADPRLALAQTPQVYYNIDSYQHYAHPRKRSLWHEATIFHHAMQPGANRLGTSFFVGTGALLRRAALAQIGGFATGSITEDIHTSMRLHAAGYRSAYVDEALGYLLAPDTPYAFAGQRLRWAQGAMQILRRENPLRKRGLSFWQRVCYFNSLSGYLLAYQHLLFYLAPGLYLMASLSPIAVDQPLALPVFVGNILLGLGTYKILARPYARVFLAECYKILSVALYIRAAFVLFKPEGLLFKVTPKGKHGGLPLPLVLPAAGIFLFNLTAAGLGSARLLQGDAFPGAVLLTTLFAIMFAIAGALALVHAYERRTAHEAFSFPLAVRAVLRGGAHPQEVDVRRLNHAVAFVVAREPIAEGAQVQLDLRFAGIEREVEATVEAAEAAAKGVVIKLSLRNLSSVERDALDNYFFNTALPRLFAEFSDSPAGPPADDKTAPNLPLAQGAPLYLPVRSELI